MNLRINEDNDVLLKNLRDAYSEEYINDATVAFVVKTAAGAELVASTTMDYQTGTNGHYLGVINKGDAANFVSGTAYYLEITITSGTYDGFRRLRATANYHGATP